MERAAQRLRVFDYAASAYGAASGVSALQSAGRPRISVANDRIVRLLGHWRDA
jgi:hypothetical protein